MQAEVILVLLMVQELWAGGGMGRQAESDAHMEIKEAQLSRLSRSQLKRHAEHLQDLSLIDLPNLHDFDTDCLSDLTHLRSLYIMNVPKLEKLPCELFYQVPSKLKSIRIMFTGLKYPPNMAPLAERGLLLHIVDLEGNKLQKLRSRGIRVRADQLILDNNEISEIEEYAFEGCELAELSLRGNKYLKTLHELSFAGIVGIRELDVSSTSIISLPAVGLASLEVLRAENTVSLKTVPSIHDFEGLRKAWMTHHFHCCAFHFPEQHDPHRHAQHLLKLERVRKLCLGERVRRHTMSSTTEGFPPTEPDYMETDSAYPGLDAPWGELSLADEEERARGGFGEHEDNDEDFGTFHETTAPPPANFQAKLICGNFTERPSVVQCWPHADALNPCDDVLGGVVARGLGWVASLASVAGNLVVAVVLVARPRSRMAPQHLLQLQLAIADLCTALYLLMVTAVDTLTTTRYFNHAYDWQYGAGCLVAGFLGVLGAQGSLLALAALTLERWLAITRALRPHSRMSSQAARRLLAASLLYSFLAACLPLFGVSDYSSTSICLPMRRSGWVDALYLGALMLGGALSVLAVAACYVHIYITLARDSRHCSARTAEARVANKMAILISCHMLCCLPIGAAGLGALVGRPLVDVHGAKLLLVVVYPLNALADPFLYAILTHPFRKDLCLLLAKYGMCTRRAQRYKVPGVCENRRCGPGRMACVPNCDNRVPAGTLTTNCDDLLISR